MNFRSILSLLVFDFLGFAAIAGTSLLLGITTNFLQPAPLALFKSPHTAHAEESFPSRSFPSITLTNLQKQATKHAAHIIDARPVSFFTLGHIPGAINVPLSDLEKQKTVEAPLLTLSQSGPLIVYCAGVSCSAAQSEAQLLAKLGYRQIRLFPGGWEEWEKAKLPVETSL